jgi:hypothetical protein
MPKTKNGFVHHHTPYLEHEKKSAGHQHIVDDGLGSRDIKGTTDRT